MFEFVGIVVLILAAIAVLAILVLVGFILKLTFKLVLLPFVLVGWAVKGLLFLLALVVGLVLAPVLVLVLGILAAVVALPLLILAGIAGLAGLLGAGWALAA